MSQNWLMDPTKKDYVMEFGDPVQTDSLEMPAYFRLIIKRTQWMYAPDVDYGSDFYLIKKRRTNENANSVENVGARALQPIIDDGRASAISVTAVLVTRSAVGLQTDITDARGNVEQLILPQI